MGGPPHTGPSKFKLFNLFSWTHQIFKTSQYTEKINLTKFGGSKMGGPPKESRQKSNFLTLHVRHMKFRG